MQASTESGAHPESRVEPTWRKANEAMRAQRKREKAQQQRARAGEGTLARLAAKACQKHPKNPLQQVNFIFANADIDAALGRDRRVSDKRKSDLGGRMRAVVVELRELNVPLQDIRNISRKNILALVCHWGKQGRKESTIDQYVNLVRRFMTLIGKAGVVPTGAEWKQTLRDKAIAAGEGRSYVALFAKGWRDLGHDPFAIFEQVRQASAMIGVLLEMMLAFGLRVNEAVQIQPYESDRGDHLFVYRGTKGGKSRSVKYSKDPEKACWQRQVLERAKELASKHPKRILAFPGVSLQQMKFRFQHAMRQHGLTRAGLGITPHGLRHQFANDLFFELSGLAAPVLRLVPHSEYERHADRVNEALLEVSRQLGHERKSITGAYLGSKGELLRFERAKAREIAKWLAEVERHAEVFIAAQVSEAWLVGSGGAGEPLAGGPLRIAVRFPDAAIPYGAVVQRLSSIQEAIQPAVAVPVEVVPWISANRPHDGAEINLEIARRAAVANGVTTIQ